MSDLNIPELRRLERAWLDAGYGDMKYARRKELEEAARAALPALLELVDWMAPRLIEASHPQGAAEAEAKLSAAGWVRLCPNRCGGKEVTFSTGSGTYRGPCQHCNPGAKARHVE